MDERPEAGLEAKGSVGAGRKLHRAANVELKSKLVTAQAASAVGGASGRAAGDAPEVPRVAGGSHHSCADRS